MKNTKIAVIGCILTLLTTLAACAPGMGPGQQHGYMMNMPFGSLFMILVQIATVVFIVLILKRVTRGDRNTETPDDIIRRRYANGEIDKEEYDRLKKDLKDS